MKEYDELITQEQKILDREVEHLLRSLKVEERDGLPMAYEEFLRWDEEAEKTLLRQGVLLRLRYVSLTNGGIKAEGDPYPWADDTAEAAVNSYLFTLVRYLGGCKHIVWRERPGIQCGTKRTDTWTVYSRLAVHT